MLKSIFGYDFFISHAHSDSKEYASKLQSELQERGYGCFLDVQEAPPGQPLTKSLHRGLKWSKALILIYSPGVIKSTWVAEEVHRFLQTRRPIITIDVGGTFAKHPLDGLMDLIRVDEQMEAIDSANPSQTVITGLTANVNFIRHRTVRQRIVSVVIAALLILSIGLGYQWFQTTMARNNLASQLARSIQDKSQAETRPGRSPLLAFELALRAMKIANSEQKDYYANHSIHRAAQLPQRVVWLEDLSARLLYGIITPDLTKLVAVTSDYRVGAWNLIDGSRFPTPMGDDTIDGYFGDVVINALSDGYKSLQISHDGRFATIATRTNGDVKIWTWEINTGRVVPEDASYFSDHPCSWPPLRTIIYRAHRPYRYIVDMEKEGEMCEVGVESRDPQGTRPEKWAAAAATKDGTRLMTISAFGAAMLWRLKDDFLIHEQKLDGVEKISVARFTPGNRDVVLFAAKNGRQVWRREKGIWQRLATQDERMVKLELYDEPIVDVIHRDNGEEVRILVGEDSPYYYVKRRLPGNTADEMIFNIAWTDYGGITRDGNFVLEGSASEVNLLETKSGKVVIGPLKVSPNGPDGRQIMAILAACHDIHSSDKGLTAKLPSGVLVSIEGNPCRISFSGSALSAGMGKYPSDSGRWLWKWKEDRSRGGVFGPEDVLLVSDTITGDILANHFRLPGLIKASTMSADDDFFWVVNSDATLQELYLFTAWTTPPNWLAMTSGALTGIGLDENLRPEPLVATEYREIRARLMAELSRAAAAGDHLAAEFKRKFFD